MTSLPDLRYGPDDAAALARNIAEIRVTSYTARLAEIGQVIGVTPAQLDPKIAARIARQSGQTAAGVVRTHNRDLGSAASRGDDLLNWEQNRADWKSRQVAFNEFMRARSQADSDFIAENDLQVGGRVVPEEAVCPICQDLVDQGDMSAEELAAVDLPAHINCQHGVEYNTDLATALGDRTQVWLGDFIDTGEGAA